MVVADLHVHTTSSDGSMALEAVPDAARKAGLQAVAITDHDRLHPRLDAPVVERNGLTVVHGIELRVDAGDQRVDLLGYGVRPTNELTTEIDRLQRDRMERGRAIVDRIESYTGVDIDVSIEPGLGRPAIASAVEAHPYLDYDGGATFDELIGDGCPCYVSRDVPTFDEGRRLLHAASDITGLAHPLRYDDPESALELTDRLDAVERFYPYGQPVDGTPVERAIEDHELIVAGGSDAHDARLGRAGLDADDYEAFRGNLSK